MLFFKSDKHLDPRHGIPWVGLFKAGLRYPRVSARFEFRVKAQIANSG